MNHIEQLRSILGEFLITDPTSKIPYSRDASYLPGLEPLAVAIPRDTEQLSKITRICYENEIRITPRGGGTSLTGSSIPTEESIVISFARMNRILEINTADRYVLVESGTRLDELNARLSSMGFMYPPDPGSSIAATVGGSISTNAGGLKGVSYGTTKEWVLGLELVLADGSIVSTGGKVLKRSDGYDLTALVIGSEGTLALIAKAYLKITTKPESVGRILAFYEDVEQAAHSISALKERGITPLIAEFVDRLAMHSMKLAGGLEFPQESGGMIIVDVQSTRESLGRHLDESLRVINSTDPISSRIITDEAEMSKISQLRKGLYSSELRLRGRSSETVLTGDIVVPTSQMGKALKEIRGVADSLKVSLFGHAGDGNIHANVFFDAENADEGKMAIDYLENIGRIAVKYGGCISAEHGIGLEKKALFIEEMESRGSTRPLELMKCVKQVFDPKGILNWGKIF
ncbi:MAG: FAD-binding oxidoreductase [Thermoplasmata archaeon]